MMLRQGRTTMMSVGSGKEAEREREERTCQSRLPQGEGWQLD